MKSRKVKWVVGGVLLLGVLAAWLVYDIAVYDACLDRINYDKAQWHVCD